MRAGTAGTPTYIALDRVLTEFVAAMLDYSPDISQDQNFQAQYRILVKKLAILFAETRAEYEKFALPPDADVPTY
jgi:hypothetical protein